MPHVFISYVREDSEAVNRLREALESNGVKVWLDRKDILPGIRWKQAIREAIREGSFFIACFSSAFIDRDKTYMHEELTLAIEELRQRPTDKVWFIPVIFSDCEIPERDIGAGETLRSIQHVQLHRNWEEGIAYILSVIELNSPETFSEVSQRGTRLLVELSEHGIKRLEELMKKSQLSTRKDFLNNAVTLLGWAIKEWGAGNVITSANKDGKIVKELEMPMQYTISQK